MEDRFLTVDEVATQLKVVPQTVRNWIDRGELRHVRIGARRIRVRESDLEDFIEGGGVSSRGASQGARLSRLEDRVDELTTAVEDLRTRLDRRAKSGVPE
jgi:excisionase family DNA binding protein